MTTTFAVTVHGPTVTLAVSVEQMVGYLRSKGWNCRVATNGWTRCAFNFDNYEEVWVGGDKWARDERYRLEGIAAIAVVEEREQSDVLRDIAAVKVKR